MLSFHVYEGSFCLLLMDLISATYQALLLTLRKFYHYICEGTMSINLRSCVNHKANWVFYSVRILLMYSSFFQFYICYLFSPLYNVAILILVIQCVPPSCVCFSPIPTMFPLFPVLLNASSPIMWIFLPLSPTPFPFHRFSFNSFSYNSSIQ